MGKTQRPPKESRAESDKTKSRHPVVGASDRLGGDVPLSARPSSQPRKPRKSPRIGKYRPLERRPEHPSFPENGVIVVSASSSGETVPRPEPTLHQLARELLVDPAAWFVTPNSQFGGRKPGDLLGTEEERKVYNLLAALDQGLF